MKKLNILGAYIFLFSLCACARTDIPANTANQIPSPTSPLTETTVSTIAATPTPTPVYKYDFAETGGLILRSEDYSFVQDMKLSDTVDRKEYGFWEKSNSENKIYYNDFLFASSDGNINRYNKDGSQIVLYEGSDDDDLYLISCEDNILYFGIYNSYDEHILLYKMENCTSEVSTVQCLYTSDVVTEEENIESIGENHFFKQGEWIYFLYSEDDLPVNFLESRDFWLYRVSETGGSAEPIETTTSFISKTCSGITKMQVLGEKILLLAPKHWKGESYEEQLLNSKSI